MRYCILSVCALLAGCADHNKDYLNHNQSIPSLIVPKTAAPLKQNDLYLIPSEPDHLPAQSTSTKPPTMNS